MDWILTLAVATFVLVIAFLAWNRMSTKKHVESDGGKKTGIGGLGDPLSGTTEGMRDPDEMRAALDNAAAQPVKQPSMAAQRQDH